MYQWWILIKSIRSDIYMCLASFACPRLFRPYTNRFCSITVHPLQYLGWSNSPDWQRQPHDYARSSVKQRNKGNNPLSEDSFIFFTAFLHAPAEGSLFNPLKEVSFISFTGFLHFLKKVSFTTLMKSSSSPLLVSYTAWRKVSSLP